MTVGVFVGVAFVLVMVLVIYHVVKHQRRSKEFLISFLNNEALLVIDGVSEVVDIIGDVTSVGYMATLRDACDEQILFIVFVVFIFPALLSSLYSMYHRVKLLKVKMDAREEIEDAGHFAKLYRRKTRGARMTLAMMAESLKIVGERRALAERQSVNLNDRRRAYFHFLLAVTEDGPFCVLGHNYIGP